MLIKRRLPVNFNPEDSAIFKVISVIELPDPSYSIYHWTILFKNGFLVNLSGVKKQSLLYNTRLKEAGGYLIILKMFLLESLKARLKFINTERPIATAINEWSNNYFHWLTEILPKVYFLKTKIPGFSLLIPASYTASFQLDSLKILKIPITYFDGMALVKKIYLPGRQAPYSAHYNPLIIKKLVSEIKSGMELSFDLGPYIYITRRKASIRKVLNETEMINVLNEFAFNVVEFESLSFEQQVSAAHHAKIMMSIHGAGLTNIMFCNPATSVYELSLEGATMDKCYYTLADACDLNYYYQFCKSPTGSNDYHSADLIIDLELLRQNLALIQEKRNA